MNPSTTILLEEWMRLAQQESAAIAASEWMELNDLLDQKDRIKRLLEDYADDDFSESDQQLVGNIISVTQQNQIQLQTEIDSVSAQIQQNKKSLTTMRQVNQTYGETDQSSFWHSYS